MYVSNRPTFTSTLLLEDSVCKTRWCLSSFTFFLLSFHQHNVDYQSGNDHDESDSDDDDQVQVNNWRIVLISFSRDHYTQLHMHIIKPRPICIHQTQNFSWNTFLTTYYCKNLKEPTINRLKSLLHFETEANFKFIFSVFAGTNIGCWCTTSELPELSLICQIFRRAYVAAYKIQCSRSS